jgi:hypothetical protein
VPGTTGFRRWADERQTRVAARSRERRVLGEKPVPRMYRVGAGSTRCVEDRLDAQVTPDRLAWPDMDRLVRFAHVKRRAIAVGIDGDRRQPHLAARTDDADGDLASIGNQDFHGRSLCGRAMAIQFYL